MTSLLLVPVDWSPPPQFLTQVVKRTVNPEWNEVFKLDAMLRSSNLVLSVSKCAKCAEPCLLAPHPPYAAIAATAAAAADARTRHAHTHKLLHTQTHKPACQRSLIGAGPRQRQRRTAWLLANPASLPASGDGSSGVV